MRNGQDPCLNKDAFGRTFPSIHAVHWLYT
jgi:hypothetical protein